MKTLLMVCLLTGLTACTPPTHLYRSSGDKSTQVVYLAPFLALEDHAGSFSLNLMQWQGEPEYANQTGDIPVYEVVSSITLLNYARAHGLVYGLGHNPKHQRCDETNGQEERTPEYFVLELDRLVFLPTESELVDYLSYRLGIRAELRPTKDIFEKLKSQSAKPPRGYLPKKWRDAQTPEEMKRLMEKEFLPEIEKGSREPSL